MELYLQINILYQVFHPLLTCCIFPLVTLTLLNLKIAKGKIVFALIEMAETDDRQYIHLRLSREVRNVILHIFSSLLLKYLKMHGETRK